MDQTTAQFPPAPSEPPPDPLPISTEGARASTEHHTRTEHLAWKPTLLSSLPDDAPKEGEAPSAWMLQPQARSFPRPTEAPSSRWGARQKEPLVPVGQNAQAESHLSPSCSAQRNKPTSPRWDPLPRWDAWSLQTGAGDRGRKEEQGLHH